MSLSEWWANSGRREIPRWLTFNDKQKRHKQNITYFLKTTTQIKAKAKLMMKITFLLTYGYMIMRCNVIFGL